MWCKIFESECLPFMSFCNSKRYLTGLIRLIWSSTRQKFIDLAKIHFHQNIWKANHLPGNWPNVLNFMKYFFPLLTIDSSRWMARFSWELNCQARVFSCWRRIIIFLLSYVGPWWKLFWQKLSKAPWDYLINAGI